MSFFSPYWLVNSGFFGSAVTEPVPVTCDINRATIGVRDMT